jgi:hypothetical protein
MLPVSSPFFWLVGGTGAVFALVGLVILFTLRRSTELLERRWAESFGPEDAPADGAPTPGLVAGAGLALLVVGGGIAALAAGIGSGSLDVTGLGDTATAVIGAIVTFVGLVALLLRSRFSLLFRTTARAYRVRDEDEILTPGVTLAITIVVTAIGVAVLLYGLFGS